MVVRSQPDFVIVLLLVDKILRQGDADAGPQAVTRRARLNGAVMLLNNGGHNSQAKPCALPRILGGEKWLKHSTDVIG